MHQEYVPWEKFVYKRLGRLERDYKKRALKIPTSLERSRNLVRSAMREINYSFMSAMNYIEVKVVRTIIAREVDPYIAALNSQSERVGCKVISLFPKTFMFDHEFFINLLEKSGLLYFESPKRFSREEMKIEKAYMQLAELYPMDACQTWSSIADEMMFWATMTQRKLRSLRKQAALLKEPSRNFGHEVMDEAAIARNWGNKINIFEWSKLVMSAALAGHDEKWLHQQFFMWLQSKLFEQNIFKASNEFIEDFCKKKGEYGVPDRRLFATSLKELR